jgi:hypothetical protein
MLIKSREQELLKGVDSRPERRCLHQLVQVVRMAIHRSLPVVGDSSDGRGVLEGLHDDYDLFGDVHHNSKLFIDF